MRDSVNCVTKSLEQNGYYSVKDMLPNVEVVVVWRIWRCVKMLRDYGYGRDWTTGLVEWLMGGGVTVVKLGEVGI